MKKNTVSRTANCRLGEQQVHAVLTEASLNSFALVGGIHSHVHYHCWTSHTFGQREFVPV